MTSHYQPAPATETLPAAGPFDDASEPLAQAPYVASYGIDDYFDLLRHRHPDLYRLLDRKPAREADRRVARMNEKSWEFEDGAAGGRGSAYNVAQQNLTNRAAGMTALLGCLSASPGLPSSDACILDVLGGDGTLARFCRTLPGGGPTIYTADIARLMIDACHAQGLPCIRQSATDSMFRDGVLDGVLIAYGSHHLDACERHHAAREAYRTLKVGGRFVLHDFEIGGKSADWFDHVVDPYSRTGHPHPHFSRQEMRDLLTDAGFGDVRVFEIEDPFTLEGDTPEQAKRNAMMHLYEMYDLVRIAESAPDIAPQLERHINDTLGPIRVRRQGDRHVAEIARQALVATGTKQSATRN